jgi:MFS family permease
MVVPFLSLYFTRELGLSAVAAGRLIALFGIGSIVGAYGGGVLSDRLGPMRVLRASLMATGVAFVAIIPLREPWAVGLAVFALGAIGDMFRPAMMVAVTRFSPVPQRARSFALMRLAANAGMAIGPAVGGWLAVHRYAWLFLGDALTCWAAAALLLFALGRAPRGESLPLDADIDTSRTPWRDPPFLAFLALITLLSMCFFQIFATMPLHLRDHYGATETSIGAVIALNALLIVLFEMVVQRRVETSNPLRVAAWGSLLVGAGLALIPLGPPFAVAIACTVVFTVGEMFALPMAMVVVGDRAEGARTGRYMGAYNVTFSVGLVVAPIVGTQLYAVGDGTLLWVVVGITGLLVCTGMHVLVPHLRRRDQRST